LVAEQRKGRLIELLLAQLPISAVMDPVVSWGSCVMQ
jgi:hypothetical protein